MWSFTWNEITIFNQKWMDARNPTEESIACTSNYFYYKFAGIVSLWKSLLRFACEFESWYFSCKPLKTHTQPSENVMERHGFIKGMRLFIRNLYLHWMKFTRLMMANKSWSWIYLLQYAHLSHLIQMIEKIMTIITWLHWFVHSVIECHSFQMNHLQWKRTSNENLHYLLFVLWMAILAQ